MSLPEPIDYSASDFGDFFDELPLWSAPFGLWILDRVPLRPDQTVLDLGAGTGFLTIELAERCGSAARVIAVDPWAAAMQRLRKKIAQRKLTNIELLEQDAATVLFGFDLPRERPCCGTFSFGLALCPHGGTWPPPVARRRRSRLWRPNSMRWLVVEENCR